MNKNNLKKISKIAITTITFFIIALTVFSMAVNKNYGNGVFNTKFFIVLSDSMKPEFEAGDIVVTKKVDPTKLEVGDIITFYLHDGTVLTHQIYEINQEDTNKVIITKGINSEVVDDTPVNEGKIIGRYSFSIPNLGNLIMFMKTTPGFIIFIFIPLLVLVFFNIVDLRKAIKQNKMKKVEVLKLKDEETSNLQAEIIRLKGELNLLSDNKS